MSNDKGKKLLHLIPRSLSVSVDAIDAATYLLGRDDEGEDADDRWCGGTLTIGTVEGDTPAENEDGIAIFNDEMPEEGCILLANCDLAPTRALRSLMAVVHGDGGHYEELVGTEQALRDAGVKFLKLHELQAAVAEYLAAREAFEEATGVFKSGFGLPKSLGAAHPVQVRWVKARLALNVALEKA